MAVRIAFQNGPDAPVIELAETYHSESEAKDDLDALAGKYGTVPEARAWIFGSKPPKGLGGEPILRVEAAVAEEETDGEVAPVDPASAIAQVTPPDFVASEASFDDLTVAELDDLAEDNDVEDYPKSGNKAEKVAALAAAGISAA